MLVYYESLLSTPFELFGIANGEGYSVDHVFFQNTSIESIDITDPRYYKKYIIIKMTIENGSECENSNEERKYFHKNPLTAVDFIDYSVNFPEQLRNFLSLYFGKVFYDNGIVRCNDRFQLPNLTHNNPVKYKNHFCFNNLPRSNFNNGNNLVGCENSIDKFLALFQRNEPRIVSFLKALESYYNALKLYNTDEVTSFIFLVRTIETLTHEYLNFRKEEYIKELPDVIKLIDQFINPNTFSSENQQVRDYILDLRHATTAKFKQLILKYLDSEFYYNHENHQKTFLDTEESEMDKKLGHFYALRSNYLHKGENIDFDVKYSVPIMRYNKKPVYGGTPAIVQMERISRYVLYKVFNEITE